MRLAYVPQSATKKRTYFRGIGGAVEEEVRHIGGPHREKKR